MSNSEGKFKYPGVRSALDGNTAVIMCERESTDAAGAYPITPSTQMGEYWAEETAKGHVNISNRPLIFVEPEGEHAAAAVTAGMSMTGLRASNFSSGQGIAYMHESLYAAVGKRLTYILNVGARAMTKATLNVHAGHDDYHCVDDTGFFQVFGKNAQQVADLNIISHKIAELALTPGIVAQDGFLTTHLIESMLVPERGLIEEYLGKPEDIIDTPTAAQKLLYGDKRRRIPEMWTVDNPMMVGLVQNQDSYMQSVAAQRPFFFDHIPALTDQCMREFAELTGRRYERVLTYRCEDAEYLILGQGSVISNAEAVADYLRETRGLKIGVVNLIMFRPFPGDMLTKILKGRKGVAVLERLDQPLAVDLPLMREIRAAISKSHENALASNGVLPYPDHAVYSVPGDAPLLYSGSFGMGSRDLQPEGLIGAVENMLPGGKQKKLFYLAIDFIREKPYSTAQDEYQKKIVEAYPNVKDLAVHGSENPNLMPKGCITVRFHSVGGWGAITTGKNLAMTLFDLLGYHIKANPKYGSEKKGQPTTYYLAASPEPIKVNCEFFYVDVVLSPDPNVFRHTNALAGLKDGGTFIIQSDLGSAAEVWASIPDHFRRIIVEKNIRIFFIDAFKIAREEASDPELQYRMQGIAFQGSFFAASRVMQAANLSEESLFKAIEHQLQHKFGGKGARVVEDNLRVVRRGYTELHEIVEKPLGPEVQTQAASLDTPAKPAMLTLLPKSEDPKSDIHRFWEQTGNFYLRGMGSDTITDPFVGTGIMPVLTGLMRDMTGIRFEHPAWIAENCTACGNCYSVCPDTALPALVNDISEIFDTVIRRLEESGQKINYLHKGVRTLEPRLRELIAQAGAKPKVRELLSQAIAQTVADAAPDETEVASAEFKLFEEELGDFQFAVTRPYYTVPEKRNKNSGGLLSINVNPYTCKGCMECVQVCNDDALKVVTQTPETISDLRRNWDFWLNLPTTPRKFVRVSNLEEGIGALETILLDKDCYTAVASGDGACLGCSEKTVIRLFCATVEALMQPRVAKQVERLTTLIEKLEGHIASNSGAAERVGGVLEKLKDLKWKYVDGVTGYGRSKMGLVNSTGCTSVWASTYPFNPYPFPWTNHLFQDSSSVAMGIFEGHMAKMADGFRAIRIAELELEGKYDPDKHSEFFTYFNWRQFSDEEFLLCPPVVAVGGDGSMYDIGFQNVSRVLASGKPIKIMVVDTQVYSNTGGQACTSGFPGQISDMAQYGKAIQG
ncbi:MAG: pyruvate ferredoxin oxidoreductase, partial [Deltaproteobacteria bacterium]|nr:pyruvate ferredoxin oxidoreductase [Deltaproteobacteria bacterium]